VRWSELMRIVMTWGLSRRLPAERQAQDDVERKDSLAALAIAMLK
jgi:hypothetical protein